MAMPSGRFFGWVIGGTLPAALGRRLAGQRVGPERRACVTPHRASSAAEEAAGGWLLDLLGLPPAPRVGFTTGGDDGQLHRPGRRPPARARRRRLGRRPARAGRRPAGHASSSAPSGTTRVDLALRYLGLGAPTPVAADDAGARPARPRSPTPWRAARPARRSWCLQAGNLHSGAFDPFGECIALAHDRGAWVHVDGAFGLWAAASPALRHLVAGVRRRPTPGPPTPTRPSTCRTTAASRWSPIPSRCRPPWACTTGYLVRAVRRAATRSTRSPSCRDGHGACRCGRRCARSAATGSPTWSSGSSRTPGPSLTAIADRPGRRGAQRGACSPRCARRSADDARTRAVTARLLADGTAWMSGSRWRGRDVLRVSVSNWSTDVRTTSTRRSTPYAGPPSRD